MTDEPKRGPGRPRKAPEEVARRQHRVSVWLWDEERDALDAARGETDLATWLRETGLRAAQRAVKRAQREEGDGP